MVLLTEGASTAARAKTAISLLRYRASDIAAVLDSQAPARTAAELFGVGGEIPVIDSLDRVPEADALVIGIASAGGRIPPEWRGLLLDAITRGLHIVSGLHDFLSDDQELAALAEQHDVRLVDVRRNSERHTADAVEFPRECLRIHTVGNDCSVGKMAAALEIQRGLSARGLDAGFAATGQTGIMIAGDGVPIDCVVADFVNGAAERLVQRMQQHAYLLIEGQGSIINPRFSAVTTGLLHGCAPDGLILCYEADRKTVKGLDHVPITPLEKVRPLIESMASARHPCRSLGVAMNSRYLDDAAAEAERRRMREAMQLPVCDVYRHGPDELVDAVIAFREERDQCN